MQAVLLLQDGTKFYGESFGAEHAISGEVVFNTGMVGHPETLTDPSYQGQILTLTYPLIGNYGVPGNERDPYGILTYFESERIQISGLIVGDYSYNYGHWSAQKSLADWLKEYNVAGITGIDTRRLTKYLREQGSMLGKIIFPENEENEWKLLQELAWYNPNEENLVEKVSTKEVREFTPPEAKLHIVLVDCGAKSNILRCLLQRKAKVTVVPWNYDFTRIDYDGILVSNGPGDPQKCSVTSSNLARAMEKNKPIFGICLGHQLLALAAKAQTYKLKYGHRGQNKPCQEVGTTRCFITSQNHGFAVAENTLSPDWEPWFKNLDDQTNEGIRHRSRPFFSVQFHPEASAGPTDTEYLFDYFLKIVAEYQSH